MWCLYLFLTLIVSLSNGETAPSFIEPCQQRDSSCILKSSQKAVPLFAPGIPEFGVETTDPLNIGDISVDISGLKFKLLNGKVRGLKDTVFDKVVLNMKKKALEFELHCNLTLKGHYKASGRLLILPISGDGEMKLKTVGLFVKLSAPFELKPDEENKDRLQLISYRYTHDIRGRANYTLTNLFGGNKELSRNLHIFLNENWKQISQEFGGPILDASMDKIFEIIQHFFAQIPFNELVIPDN